MRSINKMLLTGATALTLTATTASAAVVCNSEGDCWRVSGRPHYEPSLGTSALCPTTGDGGRARGIAGGSLAMVTAIGAGAPGWR